MKTQPFLQNNYQNKLIFVNLKTSLVNSQSAGHSFETKVLYVKVSH